MNYRAVWGASVLRLKSWSGGCWEFVLLLSTVCAEVNAKIPSPIWRWVFWCFRCWGTLLGNCSYSCRGCNTADRRLMIIVDRISKLYWGPRIGAFKDREAWSVGHICVPKYLYWPLCVTYFSKTPEPQHALRRQSLELSIEC